MARFFARLAILGLILGIPSIQPVLAETELKSVRVWVAPENTRVVFDLSEKANYKLYSLDNPYRIVLELKQTHNKTTLKPTHTIGGLLTQIRTNSLTNDTLQTVMDVRQKGKYHYFLLPPIGSYSHRLVLDIENPSFSENGTYDLSPTPQKTENSKNPKPDVKPDTNDAPRKPGKKFVVAIDAGHGGDDPGATGPRGTQEKTVVLQIAKKLADMINAEPGMVAYLTRRGDYYVSLNERVARAERKGAHLFVSVHADAYDSTNASGSTVYIGGQHTGKLLVADRENNSDSHGGVRPGGNGNTQIRNPALRALRIQSAREGSITLARSLVREIRVLNKMHRNGVQKANFVVLRGSLPSVLIETGYITNPKEEKNLANGTYQARLAKRIFRGILAYAQPQLRQNKAASKKSNK